MCRTIDWGDTALKKRINNRRALPNGVNPQHFHKSQLKIYAYVIPIAAVMALPILYIFINAFKPISELMAYPPRFYVKSPTLENFKSLFNLSSGTAIPMSRYLFNSVIVTAATVFANIYISVTAGYTLSKKQFRTKNFILTANTIALSFITVAVAIPRYFIIYYTGLQNNFLSNIIPLIVTPTCIFLTKQFIDQLPNALIEAAIIDGASDYQILRKIVVPLVTPTLATVAMLSFQSAWNATEASTLFLDNESLKTFAYYMGILPSNVGNAVAGMGISAAGTLIMFLPNLVLFIILQSRVMNTMAHSGIK